MAKNIFTIVRNRPGRNGLPNITGPHTHKIRTSCELNITSEPVISGSNPGSAAAHYVSEPLYQG